jgi:hypothetical protein
MGIETMAETALEWALKYASMGIRVFPLRPGTKEPATPNGVKDATLDADRIRAWWTENPAYGVALAPEFKVGGACFLEFDQKPWLPAWCKEENQPKPITRLHKSGGKNSPHYIFLHTEKSLELGNVNGNYAGYEWFSFRADGRYVVAPPSVHPDSGNPYTVELDAEPVPVPDWLVAKIAKEGTSEHKFSGTLRECSEEFDPEAFFDWLEECGCKLGIEDGAWIPFMVCPIAGHRHAGQGTRGCALFWDGGSLGFKCMAQGCESNVDRKPNQSGIGYLVSFLSREFEPYEGIIWDKESEEQVIADFGAREALLPVADETHSDPKSTHSEPKLTPDEQVIADAEKIVEKWEAQSEIKIVAEEPKPQTDAAEFVVQEGKNAKGDVFSLMGTLAADIVPERLEWQWRDKVPAGKVTLFAGQPDCGKTLALLDFIAHVTTGKDFPDGAPNPNPKGQRVLLAATEDDLKSTLIPRLIAAGADLTKVVILERVMVKTDAKQKTKRRMLQLDADAKLLKLALKNNPDIAMVALDPISSYFGACDPNKDKEIRPVMEAIADACEATRAAFIGIIHNNKRGDADAIGKILGASSVVGVSRAVWGFAKDKEKKGEFFMSLVKGNLARKRDGMKYQIIDAFVLIDGKNEILPRIEWLGESEESADEVMAKNKNVGEGKDKKHGVAVALIESALKVAPRLARDMYALGEKQGLSDMTMKRAYRELGVFVKKQPGGPWWWSFDEAEPWRGEPVMEAGEAL